ncbi:class I SAM-dependent methyltransferase [Candidatus Dependentiae bacterium]|nr:class I SAM-dependent methyltransferase [Candidatus Dependentiae bacterium]
MEVQRIDANKQQLLSYSIGAVRAELQALLDESTIHPDIQFYLDIVQRRGGLTLELGSGTGRLLLQYLLAGVHVHGIETSPELYAICNARAQALGVVPTIHKQQLDRLDLPMSFKTIYAPCGVIQKINCIESIELVLQKLFEHLEMNGQLIIALEAPQQRKFMEQPSVWHMIATVERSHDHARMMLSQTGRSDFVEQKTLLMERYDIFHPTGELETYLHEQTIRWYYKFEFKLMLERAGFSEIVMLGDYTTDLARDEHSVWVFLATKRG